MEYKIRDFTFIDETNCKEFEEVVSYFKNNIDDVYSFFGINKIDDVKILIPNFDSFKDFIVSKYGLYRPYVTGDCDYKTKTIRMLNISDRRNFTNHKNDTIESLLKTSIHEAVHMFHNSLQQKYDYKDTWFKEGLAECLSGRMIEDAGLNFFDMDKLINDWYNFGSGNYLLASKIVKYMLEEYSHDEILNYVKNSDTLIKDSKKIFCEAKKYYGSRERYLK